MTEQDAQKVSQMIKDNDIQIIDLKFNDLPGLWQHFSITPREMTELDDIQTSIWVDGIGFDGSSIRGFQKIQESDMILIPDPSSARIDRMCQIPTLSADLRHQGPAVQAALHARPAVRGAKGGAVPDARPASPTQRSSGRSSSSSSSTTSASTRPRTAPTTTSTASRASGTPAATRSRTSATSRASRKATSRYRRTTPCRTSAAR